ncbi:MULTISPECIES: SDR family oxidoreductase [Pseudomonas]|uniref:SDR family oxidoreductase n=1 Tax=Pseudomonas donghuensis TaxID=1163398 RepID=A0AAP0SJF7_9PSED|nr:MULTISPECIES: SDR family oxidoreductase [Pseudomonas]MDF9891564.1 NAD(P)-dependent dehydrogenase (short-subunit alcohol dehydrogenase family) [Pseudomonas vranovensis]KDN99703.1 SDR family oxidoreductase [Pseudomonas donghuensis]MBF4211237.1 SDR family oxidoreductase [Pseudomonas donghuensis]MBS7599244.1 SDR family oxidoreductase [Pseudomonas sp. RC2C2]MCP3750413.1 SDR family oxidoreductase [Pseudomonas sp. SBB6]
MSTNKTALIIGASRGLGLGLVQRLVEDGWNVVATVRDLAKAEALSTLPRVQVQTLEMNNARQLDALQERLAAHTFDLLFVNAGVKGPEEQNPEQARLADVGELFMTNSVAPIRVAQRFAPQLRKDTGVIAFMSSVLGSVSIPDAPELCLYKASKAALNSMINSFVVQLGEPQLTVLAMHPGWVKTDMGGEGADIDVPTSTRGMVDQVHAHSGKGGLQFINYKGESLIW